MRNSFNIAIDLGSRYVTIYKQNVGVVLKEPALVAVDSMSKAAPVVGTAAYNLIGKTNYQVNVFAPINGGVINDLKYASIMLTKFLSSLVSSGVLPKKNRAIFVIPSGLTDAEKKDYFTLGYDAGISCVGLVTGLVPALLNMGISENDPRAHMLVSVGYSLCDIAVIHGLNIIKGGTINIGAQVLSTAIADYIGSKFGISVSIQSCEMILSSIGTLLPNDIRHFDFEGLDIETKRYKTGMIFSAEIFPIVSRCIDKVADSIEVVLSMCSSDVIADIHKNGIYLCGGLSKITGIDKYLTEKLGYNIYTDIEPEVTIISGAGILLNNARLIDTIVQEDI